MVTFLFADRANAQRIRFTDHSNRWVKYGSGNPSCPYTYNRILTYGTDTVIDGISYQHLLENIHVLTTTGCTTIPTANYFVREDTIAGIIYYRNLAITASHDTMEHIYFNYNLVAGDTINYLGSIHDSVLMVDSTLINGIYHKIFYMGSNRTMSVYTFLEGVGSMKFPYVNFMDGCDYGYEELECFSQGTTLPDINFLVYSCYVTPGTLYHNGSSCLGDGVENYKKTKYSFTVTPNPVAELLTIQGSELINNIEIFRSFGKLLFKKSPEDNYCQVDVSEFNSGVYLVRINNIEVRKFIKL